MSFNFCGECGLPSLGGGATCWSCGISPPGAFPWSEPGCVDAGARASKQKTTITNTSTDEKEVKEPPIGCDPYAGTGLQVAVANNLALSTGATWIFPDDGKPDVQYTFGLNNGYMHCFVLY